MGAKIRKTADFKRSAVTFLIKICPHCWTKIRNVWLIACFGKANVLILSALRQNRRFIRSSGVCDYKKGSCRKSRIFVVETKNNKIRWTATSSFCKWTSNRFADEPNLRPFAFRKAVKRTLKGRLLNHKRRPFATPLIVSDLRACNERLWKEPSKRVVMTVQTTLFNGPCIPFQRPFPRLPAAVGVVVGK